MTQPVRTAPTLAEVAAAAGVSRSTASRALNDSPRISEETKKRVRAAAKEVNFVPNARGRALAVGRTEIIAVLVTEPLSELFSDPTYSEFLSGITEELSESSYLPVILQASSTHERAARGTVRAGRTHRVVRPARGPPLSRCVLDGLL